MSDQDLRALFEAAQKLALPQVAAFDAPVEGAAGVMFVPSGMTAVSTRKFLDAHLPKPRRTTGVAELVDLASLIAHARRFAGGSAVKAALFADPTRTAPKLSAVYDYHDAGAPDWMGHQARYAFPLSDAWQAWRAANGVNMGQADFASFIEDRVLDVLEPVDAGEAALAMVKTLGAEFASPSRLLDLSRNLSVSVGQSFKSASKLSSGETQIQFVEEHTTKDGAGAPVKMPGAVLLGIQVFREGPLYQVPARLRYRVAGPVVAFRFDLFRTEVIFDHAFRESCDLAAKETGLPLFYGAAEAPPVPVV